ncbi:MAG: hypothetical protein EOM26_11740 [Alphaproteobacteria bacterium]|nr:hypothetical protein [Alphaproteobacteria bacterium]
MTREVRPFEFRPECFEYETTRRGGRILKVQAPEDVKAIQRGLVEAGLLSDTPRSVDGLLGKNTGGALKKLAETVQKDLGIAVDGEFNRETLDALERYASDNGSATMLGLVGAIENLQTAMSPDGRNVAMEIIYNPKHFKVSDKAECRIQVSPPAEAAPVEAAPVEAAPVEAAPVEAAPVEAAPVEAAPVEAAPVEAAPVEAAPVEAAPVEAAPVEAAPVEAAPVEAAPVEEAPVEAAPVEAAPVEAAPVEAAPVEAAPVEAAPVEAAPAVDPAGPTREEIRTSGEMLHNALLHGNADDLPALLEEHVAGIDHQNDVGSTPLKIAVALGNVPAAKVLLDAGADPTIPNDTGQTPIDDARDQGLTGLVSDFEQWLAHHEPSVPTESAPPVDGPARTVDRAADLSDGIRVTFTERAGLSDTGSLPQPSRESGFMGLVNDLQVRFTQAVQGLLGSEPTPAATPDADPVTETSRPLPVAQVPRSPGS